MSERPGLIHDRDVWSAFERWRRERRRCVLATVTGTRGFTPRKAGAHMLIAVGGESVGTVGGGAIEHRVREEAAALLERGGTCELHHHLTQDLGMCCGGEMTVFLEVVESAPRLFVFGAGYIAKPLAAVAAGCGFAVTVVDARAEWASPERFPTSTVWLREPDQVARELETTDTDWAIVVTHDHACDQRVVQELLRRPLRFIGMIGSIAKQRKFALRLRARGFSDDDIARLRSPLGVEIGAQTPEEIAVSVVAELIAARHGASESHGWIPPARAGRALAASGSAGSQREES
ncbi:MAG: xanthine dehydrogenase accessory protein XdhC [Candidatus Eisenbacteria bacterium]|nr:xanthine dehydrogenase accessory protein XdhC [Candidatus Eisenbacteria bacterium]